MKLSDFPPSSARDYLWEIIDRWKDCRKRFDSGCSMEIHLTLDQARLLYAGGAWLQKYSDWENEARNSGGKIGVHPCTTSLSYAAGFLTDKSKEIDKSDPIVRFSEKEMWMLKDCAAHLDHYVLMMAGKDKPNKGNWKRR